MTDAYGDIVNAVEAARGRPVDWSEAELEYVVETNAFGPSGAREGWREDFQTLIDLVEKESQGRPSIYCDTTTIWTAVQLIAGNAYLLGANTFMDLDKLTRAIVLNDRVFHLPSPHFDSRAINTLLGEDVMVPLDPVFSRPSLHRVVWDIWYYHSPEIANHAQSLGLGEIRSSQIADGRHLFEDLAAFHGVSLLEKELKVEGDASSVFTSDPRQLVRNLVNETIDTGNLLMAAPMGGQARALLADRTTKRHDLLLDALRELVHRSAFHQLLADALGLVYDPSYARMPAVEHLSRNSTQMAVALADIEQLEHLVGQRLSAVKAEHLALSQVPVTIPPFTAYALRRAHRLEDWWEIVSELRGESRRYRAMRREFQEGLFRGEAKILRSLNTEIQQEAARMSDAAIDASLDLASSAGEASGLLIPGLPAAFVGPVLQALRLVLGKPTKMGINALRRRLRPELRLFYTVAQAATSCLKLENQVRLLWNTDLPDSFYDLERYAQRSA